MTPALIFMLRTVVQLFLLVLLLRFWLPWLRADFRNPVAQGILRLTSPLVVPLRRLIPPIGRLDTATVLIIVVVQYLALFLIFALIGVRSNLHSPPEFAVVEGVWPLKVTVTLSPGEPMP